MCCGRFQKCLRKRKIRKEQKGPPDGQMGPRIPGSSPAAQLQMFRCSVLLEHKRGCPVSRISEKLGGKWSSEMAYCLRVGPSSILLGHGVASSGHRCLGGFSPLQGPRDHITSRHILSAAYVLRVCGESTEHQGPWLRLCRAGEPQFCAHDDGLPRLGLRNGWPPPLVSGGGMPPGPRVLSVWKGGSWPWRPPMDWRP